MSSLQLSLYRPAYLRAELTISQSFLQATVYKNHADGFMEPLQTWVDEDVRCCRYRFFVSDSFV